MVGLVMRENTSMRELALSVGFKLDAAGSDADAVRLVLELAPPGLSAPSGPERARSKAPIA